jgi:DNA-binding transcriptional ArsR family regulator
MTPRRIEREIAVDVLGLGHDCPHDLKRCVATSRHIGRPMSAAPTEVDELFSAVADPTRRRVIGLLVDRGEATATMLAGELPVTRQAVVKQLSVLNRAGLVQGRRNGREVRYAIRPQRLGAATRSMTLLAADWDARLSTIKRIAETAARERREERQRHEEEL